MSIKTLILVLALALFVSVTDAAAIPATAPQSLNAAEEVKRALFKRAGWCNNSSFQNKSSPGSPFVNDCLAIMHLQEQMERTYQVSNRGNNGYFQELARYGTCVFAAKGIFRTVKFGNQDIVDLISDSVRKFAWFDKVGAEGTLGCNVVSNNNSPMIAEARWAIYHT